MRVGDRDTLPPVLMGEAAKTGGLDSGARLGSQEDVNAGKQSNVSGKAAAKKKQKRQGENSRQMNLSQFRKRLPF